MNKNLALKQAEEKIAQADVKIAELQRKEQEQTLTAMVFSATVSSAMRRDYLESRDNLSLRENYIENIPHGKINWLKLMEVGIQEDYHSNKISEVLECMLNAFHLPQKKRLLFLVSSNPMEGGGKIDIHLGLQSLQKSETDDCNIEEVMSGFSKSLWPGLSFASTKEVDEKIFSEKRLGKRPGVRILTGIPAVRGEGNVDATIDKLVSALQGYAWRYLVIAEPVSTSEVHTAVHTYNELAGKAESLKTFQMSSSMSKAINNSWSHADSSSYTESKRKEGIGRGAVVAGCATLAAFAPVLLPVFASTFLGATAATAATAAVWGKSAQFGLSLVAGALLAGTKTESESTSFTDTITMSVTETEGVTFSETIISKHAEAVVKNIEKQIERLKLCEGVGTWEVGTYFIGENETIADIGSHVLRSLISGDDSYLEPIRVFNFGRPEDETNPLKAISQFGNPNIIPMFAGNLIRHPLGARFETLKTIINTRELTQLINFPLSNIPGIPVRKIAGDIGLKNIQAVGAENGIVLGKQIYRGQILPNYPYLFDKNMLAKHTLICGINGSGKTNTILGILNDLLSKNMPFLVIEPAKQEYVEWAMNRNLALKTELGDVQKAKRDKRWINIYVPGRESWKGETIEKLQLNPFDFVWLNDKEPPKTLEHIDCLKTIINAAMPMQEVLPVLMEELIYMAYGVLHSPRKVGEPSPCWLPKNSSQRYPEFDEPIHLPSFQSLSVQLQHLFKSRTYAKDVQLNLRAALETRIDSFKRGWRKELLNKDAPRHTKDDWEKLFEHPTVVNLTSLASDEDKAFFMAILLLFVYEYRQACTELNEANNSSEHKRTLNHLLVIEEAHRVLGKAEPASAFSANPRQKVSEMFSNMISEIGAYGQGILIADQIPSRLNEDAIKNTNMKIVHKLVAADDRAAMATALNLWDEQERIIGDLNVGEVLVREDLDKQAIMVKVKPSWSTM